jgi:hypothetical protein
VFIGLAGLKKFGLGPIVLCLSVKVVAVIAK